MLLTAESPWTDSEVVARVLGGESRAFEIIMRRHNQRIFRAARAIVRTDDEAEDVMQEAYVRAFDHLAEFRGEAKLSTWLTRIAVHEALARVRRAKRTSDDEVPDMESPTHGPEQRASDEEMRALLEEAVDALPESFRVVFVLRAVEQMSTAEVATALDIPEDTVKTRFF